MVENMPSTLSKFKIAYGESAESMTNEVTTSSLERIRKEDGSYNWYIDKLPVKSYSFKIFGMKADGSLIADLSSEVLSATIGQKSCSIGDIGAISLSTTADKTTLSWTALS